MKKPYAIVIGLFVLLAFLAAILFKVIGPTTKPAPQAPEVVFHNTPASTSAADIPSPSAVARACITWYLQTFAPDAKGVTDDSIQKGLSQCFKESFSNSWDSIRDDIGEDPVLYSANITSSALSVQSSSLVSQTTTSSTVLITLADGSKISKLSVLLDRTTSGWLISEVLEPK